jgi:hypothetical protein
MVFGAKPGCAVGTAHCCRTFSEPSTHGVWRQTRASRCAIVSVCCAVGPAHCRRTFSEPSTHGVWRQTRLRSGTCALLSNILRAFHSWRFAPNQTAQWELRIVVKHSQSHPLTTFGAKPGCEVGPAHCRRTFSEPSTHDVWRQTRLR